MAAHQAPPSLGFSRQEHWSGLPFPSLVDRLADGIFDSHTPPLSSLFSIQWETALHIPWTHPATGLAHSACSLLRHAEAHTQNSQLPLPLLCEASWDRTSLLWVSGVGQVWSQSGNPWGESHHWKAALAGRRWEKLVSESPAAVHANSWNVPHPGSSVPL